MVFLLFLFIYLFTQAEAGVNIYAIKFSKMVTVINKYIHIKQNTDKNKILEISNQISIICHLAMTQNTELQFTVGY